MAVPEHPLKGQEPITARPKPGVDREALRKEISERYAHTLRRLGK